MPIQDDSFVARYIRAIENPDSIGFKNGIWYQSPRKGDDYRNRGFGVDILNNEEAKALTQGRKGKYLTEEEERSIRNNYIEYAQRALRRHTPGMLLPSETREAMAIGMLYRGDSVNGNPI